MLSVFPCRDGLLDEPVSPGSGTQARGARIHPPPPCGTVPRITWVTQSSRRNGVRRYILLSLAVTAISGFASNAYGAANPKVGLSFSDFATERWARERDEMSKLLKDAGYEVLIQE